MKPPLPQYVLDILCDEGLMNPSKAITDRATAQLRALYLAREDRETTEAIVQFTILCDYAGRYTDYRFRRLHECDAASRQSVAELASCGIGEHASSQLIRMSEEIVDSNITRHVGREL